MNLGGPSDFDEFFPNETPEQELYRLKNDMHDLTIAYMDSVKAIQFLIAHCQKNNIDPFPEGPLSLQTAIALIRSLEPEELKKRNEIATRRIKPRAKSADAINMKEAFDDQKKMIEEFKENPLVALLCGKQEIGATKTITLQEYCDAAKDQPEDNLIRRMVLNEASKIAKDAEAAQ